VLPFFDPPVQEDELGRLSRYRILSIIGWGGMGVVCQAHDPELDRIVALKVILPRWAGHAAARQRFLREARAAAAVAHDHIVPIYDRGQAGEVLFIVMPLLAGETLADRLSVEERLDWREACRIGREVAEGLAAAHERGLIHRDIKPGNLWLERRRYGPPRVRILDFGLARPIDGTDPITSSGEIVGTPAFMSPEQARGEELGVEADLYSLGCVLYLVLTGRLPRPCELVPITNVPAELSELVLELLCPCPADRPRSADEVAWRLGAVEQGEWHAG
jgi:serine/threonine protein kinase